MSDLTVHLAETVVQQDVGGTGCRRRRIRSDDAVECECRHDRVVLKPAQHADGAAEFGIVIVKPRGILGGEFRVGLASPRRAVGHEQSALIVDRPEIGGRPLDNLQAIPLELEIGNDLRIQQAHRV